MYQVLKIDPDRQRCPELLARFWNLKDACSYCKLYDWKVLDAESGLMYDMFIGKEEWNYVLSCCSDSWLP